MTLTTNLQRGRVLCPYAHTPKTALHLFAEFAALHTSARLSARANYAPIKRSSHFSTQDETLPPTRPANANSALRASPTG